MREERRREQIAIWVSVVVTAMVSGACAPVPMASTSEDAQGKVFSVPDGKSWIYVYRIEAEGPHIPVEVDGKWAGQLPYRTYLICEVEPGTHEVTSRAEQTITAKFTTEAGQAHFLWTGRFLSQLQVGQVDESTGRSGVSACRRVKSRF